MVGGVSAKVICSIDEYLKKRNEVYPKELAPKKQVVSNELEQWMWNEFYKKRNV